MNKQLTKEELRTKKLNRTLFSNIKRRNVYLVLDNLKCAHNSGTILRLADSLLIKKVYICGDRTIIPPNKKIRNSSRGAERWVPWECSLNVLDIITNLKEKEIEVVAVELSKKSICYQEYIPKDKVCYVFGNEFVGVSNKILGIVDKTIHLPMLGMSNSLNVSTVASVILYYDYNKKFKK